MKRWPAENLTSVVKKMRNTVAIVNPRRGNGAINQTRKRLLLRAQPGETDAWEDLMREDVPWSAVSIT